LSLMGLAAVLGVWSMRFMAPAPLPLPITPLATVVQPTDVPWRSAFTGNGGAVGPIMLRGVITGNAQNSIAVLSVSGSPGRAYRVGSDIAPGVTLIEVTGQGVTLKRNGVRENLTMAARPLTSSVAKPASPPTAH
jgi:general secretion pathway protein C